ncbi:unnamed protein product [Phyllotreta striolata]|uniref:Major facilitator superfamily (MFS) profile domain-containing protein n=1 Tax=Phyllotreta striolata TaxID=444603 RepID=A0A9N9XR91_PHYSR|nr:unnamed protein product [Phyllotreta striolata]
MTGENNQARRTNFWFIISVIAGTLGAVSDGIQLGISSVICEMCSNQVINKNSSLFNNSDDQNGVPYLEEESDRMLFKTFYMLGALAGFLLSSPFSKVGPKLFSAAASVLSLFSWIILAATINIPAIFVARILAGISITLTLSVSPNYISEISGRDFTKSSRGLVYYALIAGIFLIYVIGPLVSVKLVATICAVIMLVQMLCTFIMVESPYHLMTRNKILEAKASLMKIYEFKMVESERRLIQGQVTANNRDRSNQGLFKTDENQTASIKIIVTSFAQQFTGITVIIMSLHEILIEAHTANVHALITAVAFVLVIGIIALLHELIAINVNAMISAILSTLSLLSLAIYFSVNSDAPHVHWISIVAIIIYGAVIRFDKGYFPNAIAEKFHPNALKSPALRLSTFTHILAAWISIELYQRMKYSGRIDIPFYVFSVFNLANTIILKRWFNQEKHDVTRRGPLNDGIETEDTELIEEPETTAVPENSKEHSNSSMTVSSRNIFQGTFPQLIAVLSGTLTAISDGMQYGWTAPVIPILRGPNSPVEVTKQQAEWLEHLLMIGSFSGLSLTMYLVDKIGRKKSILLASFVTVCIWILTAVAPRVEYIYVARLFAGAAGNMAFVATPMYIAEIAEQKIRGFLSSLIYLMMLVGIFLIYAVAPYIPFYAHCVIGALLAFIQLCIFPLMPESPYYLLYRDQPDEAKRSLRRLRCRKTNIDKELEDIKAAVNRQKEERGKLQDLFLVPSNRRAIIIMAILNGAQHFSSISVLLMNTHVILNNAGSVYVPPNITAILFALLMVIAASVASFTIDKFGRRTLLISSSLATGLCLMVLAIYFNLKNAGYNTVPVSWIPVACILTYAVVFKLGLGMVPIVLTAELFPAKVKAYGMTLADGTYVIACLLSLQVYQRLYAFGLQYPFYVFSVSCYIAAIFTYLFIPETKGKTLEQIQMILKGRSIEDAGKNMVDA